MADLPFLGCRISLISKCDIRYEGILYRVDAKESTIALSKVKSYGTETRGDPSCYIAPKDEVYDIIIFRASDVKDLRVDAPEPPGLSDPAIISAHHSYPGQSTSTSTFNSKSSNANNQISSNATGNNERNNEGRSAHADSRLSDLPHRSGRPGPGANDHRGENSRNDGPQRRGPMQGGHRVRSGDRANERTGNRVGGEKQQQQPQRNERSGGGNYRQQNNDKPANNNRHNERPLNSNNINNNNGNMNNNRGSDNRTSNRSGGDRIGNRNGNNDRPGPRNGHRFGDRPGNRNGYRSGDRTGAPRGSRKTAPLKFERDYDFVKANELFLELEGKFKGLKVKEEKDGESSGERDSSKNQADNSESGSGYDSEDQNHKDGDSKDGLEDSVSGEFYDKNKSFFDSISCEASERSQGKVNKLDWRKERQTNAETFGVSAHYRRGGYRGRAFGTNRYHRK